MIFIEVIEQFLDSEDVEVIRLAPEIFDRAFELYKTRPDREWGLLERSQNLKSF